MSMLQHSRISSGVKEPTDINALAGEYLRLSYHGFRAKVPRDSVNNSFIATMKTDFDQGIGSIDVVPQELGRVLLNLYNNAFYSLNERKKRNDNGYEPILSVNTKKVNDKVEVKVADNGNGIPHTKPPGQGTGLGLSLAYDIIKAHDGELKVETKEGEGSTFTILLTSTL